MEGFKFESSVFNSGQGVNGDWKGMRIEGAVASIFYLCVGCLTGESIGVSPMRSK